MQEGQQMSKSNSELMQQSERLYDQCDKPLEQYHWGEYVAIFKDGKTLVGGDLMDASDRALDKLDQRGALYLT